MPLRISQKSNQPFSQIPFRIQPQTIRETEGTTKELGSDVLVNRACRPSLSRNILHKGNLWGPMGTVSEKERVVSPIVLEGPWQHRLI